MDIVSLLLTIIGIIIAIIFGYLQVVVPFIKGEVRFSKHFPFVESPEAPAAAKQRRRRKKKTKKRFLIPGLAIGILIILIVLIRFLVFQTKAIERVPIAVISFTNRTGDQRFDYLSEAIPNLLITNLEQSRHLSIMTWERMHDLMKVLGKEGVRAIGEELGFQICEMDDIHAIVIGSFTKAGDMFVTEAKVLDVRTKKLLKSVSSEGQGVASILKTQIDELSKNIARGVSRYERVIETTDFKIMDVITSSMDAYNYFIRGRNEWEEWHYEDARRFLQKAIELDSTFASAYYWLALTHYGLQDAKAGDEAAIKAKELSNKVSEKEKLYIDAMYAGGIEYDQDEAFRIIKKIAKKYPEEKRAHMLLAGRYRNEREFSKAIEEHKKALELDPNYGVSINDLAYIYSMMGDYDKAIEYFERYARVFPGDANPFDSMGDVYFQMGLIDEALAKYKEAIDVEPDFALSSPKIAYIYALREDYTEALKWVDHYIAIAPRPEASIQRYPLRADYKSLLGNFTEALSDLDKVETLFEPGGWEYARPAINRRKGWCYYDMKQFELSSACFEDGYIEDFDSAFSIVHHNFPLALVDLKQGYSDSARVRLAVIKESIPHVHINFKDWAQLLHDFLYAELLIAEHSLEEAIAVSKAISKVGVHLHRPGFQSSSGFIPLYSYKDIAARLYVKQGDIDRAILEYERLTDPDPNKRGRCLINPTWRYELAKLYEQKGLKAKAIQQYERFLDIWKDADPDRPELIDAKKRLANLEAST